MNRMDCFRKTSPFHYGGTMILPRPDHYPITHKKVMAVVSKEWTSTGDIGRRIPKVQRPTSPTIRRHLNDAEQAGEIMVQANRAGLEWRRV